MVTTLAVVVGLGAADGGGATCGRAIAHEDKPSATETDTKTETTTAEKFFIRLNTSQSPIRIQQTTEES
jgi:hypothetical protein